MKHFDVSIHGWKDKRKLLLPSINKVKKINMSAEVENSLTKLAHDYFRTLSPLAEKINADIEEVIVELQDHWSSLKPKEKEKIIGNVWQIFFPHPTFVQFNFQMTHCSNKK